MKFSRRDMADTLLRYFPMNKFKHQDITILDCTIRDGGYLNNWQFDKKLVREVYRSVSKAGVEIMEIGFRGTEKYFDREKYGLWRFSDEDTIRDAIRGIDGAKLALMADFGKIEADDFLNAEDSVVDIVRVAAHKDDLFGALKLLEKIKKKGYQVSLNAMGYSNYTPGEREKIISALKKSDIDFIYVVDSYGSMFPNELKSMLDPLLEIPDIKVGFHPHNSLQMAFSNTLEAIRCGAHLIDSTFYGMGRGAGNLPTEIIVLYMELMGKKKYNVIPILNCIDAYFLPLRKEMEWGYQLPFMLSGMYKCHPSYAKGLIDFREYTIEDISRAMEFIRQRNPVGYSPEILKELIEGGLIGRLKPRGQRQSIAGKKNEKIPVPYVNRHKGRDFLILANGPTLREYREKINKFIKKIDPVILGANNLSGLFAPHYHAFNNKRRFMNYIDTVTPESKLLLSQHFSEGMIKEYTDRDYEKLYYKDVLNAKFDIKEGMIETNCRTISTLLIGIAIAMGAKRIFVAGMDGYLGHTPDGGMLYYEEKDEKTDRDMIIERHMWCQKFLEGIEEYLLKQGQEGIHIITPTTYKTFYKSIENYINKED